MSKPFRYIIGCRTCNKPMTIVEVYFTKGTTIVFEVVCVKCNVYEERPADFFRIQADIYSKLGTTCIEGNEVVQ